MTVATNLAVGGSRSGRLGRVYHIGVTWTGVTWTGVTWTGVTWTGVTWTSGSGFPGRLSFGVEVLLH